MVLRRITPAPPVQPADDWESKEYAAEAGNDFFVHSWMDGKGVELANETGEIALNISSADFRDLCVDFLTVNGYTVTPPGDSRTEPVHAQKGDWVLPLVERDKYEDRITGVGPFRVIENFGGEIRFCNGLGLSMFLNPGQYRLATKEEINRAR